MTDELMAALSSDERGPLVEMLAAADRTVLEDLMAVARNTEGDRDVYLQRRALWAIGQTGDETLVANLLELIPDLEEPLLKVAAIDAIGRAGGARAFETVSGLLDDESVQVRLAAVTALDRLGTDAALDRLADLARGSDLLAARARRALKHRTGRG